MGFTLLSEQTLCHLTRPPTPHVTQIEGGFGTGSQCKTEGKEEAIHSFEPLAKNDKEKRIRK